MRLWICCLPTVPMYSIETTTNTCEEKKNLFCQISFFSTFSHSHLCSIPLPRNVCNQGLFVTFVVATRKWIIESNQDWDYIPCCWWFFRLQTTFPLCFFTNIPTPPFCKSLLSSLDIFLSLSPFLRNANDFAATNLTRKSNLFGRTELQGHTIPCGFFAKEKENA